MHLRSKIICTIGPGVSSYDSILQLIDAGMNVARLNFSHGDHESHAETIASLKKARKEKGVPLAIMLDTKGPEVRVEKFSGDGLSLKEGDRLTLVGENSNLEKKRIGVTPGHIIKDLKEGDQVLFDDGYIISTVKKVTGDEAEVELENDGVLKSGKGINIPGSTLSLPSMTERDKEDLRFGCEQEVDILAASFIRTVENVLDIRSFLKQHWKKEIMIISKIESVLGVKNFNSILQVSDGIMIARGDLGVELPLDQVPKLQKMMIRGCFEQAKPAVIATQMLESMIHNPRPTRAEVSDVANAIYDSASCVMLSGETAVGKYPIECVNMMGNVIAESEKDFDYKEHFYANIPKSSKDISTSVALATVKTAYSSDAEAIITYTSSGFTSRLISRFRPKVPIISLTNCMSTYNQLSFLWGVVPVYGEFKNEDEAFEMASCYALRHGYVHYGDLVLVTAGTPFGLRGTTNMMLIKSIGDVIVRGQPSKGEKFSAKATIVVEVTEGIDVKDKIVIIQYCRDCFEKQLKGAKAIVLQNHRNDPSSEDAALEIGRSLSIPVITQVDNASNLIDEGELVTLDPKRGLVFRGEASSDKEMISKYCQNHKVC